MSEQATAEQYLQAIGGAIQEMSRNQASLTAEVAAQREHLARLAQPATPPGPDPTQLQAIDKQILDGLTTHPSRVFAEFAGNLRQSIQQESDAKLQQELASLQGHAAQKEFERDWLARNSDLQPWMPYFENYLYNSTDPRLSYADRVEQAATWTRQAKQNLVAQEQHAAAARHRAQSMPAPGGYDMGMMGMGAAIERNSQEVTMQMVQDQKKWQAARRSGFAAQRAA